MCTGLYKFTRYRERVACTCACSSIRLLHSLGENFRPSSPRPSFPPPLHALLSTCVETYGYARVHKCNQICINIDREGGTKRETRIESVFCGRWRGESSRQATGPKRASAGRQDHSQERAWKNLKTRHVDRRATKTFDGETT